MTYADCQSLFTHKMADLWLAINAQRKVAAFWQTYSQFYDF